jgi:dipeptidyl aminopeptidase/acylaminoacyl peptidase
VALAVPALLAAEEGYRQPPAPIPQILDADLTPLGRPSPDGAWLLLLERAGLPSIEEVAAPELRLAGRRINPRTSGPSREIGSFKGLRLARTDRAGGERRIELPKGAQIENVLWAADSSKIAFTLTGPDRIELWIADPATATARRLSDARLSGVAGAPCAWVSPREGLVCRVVAAHGAAPAPPPIPVGPVVQESVGRAAPNPTYEDLLASPVDEALFEHHFTSQVARIGLDGSLAPIGALGIHLGVDPSPDGRFLMVQTVHRPFSYLVPMERFPRLTEIWDASGKVVRKIADTPLQEEVPLATGSVPVGPRDVSWRDDTPATLSWVEAIDGGDASRKADKRDRLLALAPPFGGDPVKLMDLEYRLARSTWSSNGLAFVDEGWRKTRRTRTWAIAPGNPAQAPRLVFDRSSEDRYGNPGVFLTTETPQGTSVLLTTKDGRSAYLVGQGASPEGDRPFLDRMEIATGKTTRLWRSEAPYFEEPVRLLDGEGQRLLTRRESVSEVPNYYVRETGKPQLTRLTDFPDPAPQLAGVRPQLIHYKRADGVELSATLYLPPGYDKSKGPLPFFFWAYPLEFKSAAAAAQVSGSPHRFTRPNGPSPLLLLTQGYGVLDNPTMPIVGEGDKEPNDTYVEQLVASAKAAVDAVVAMGVADPERIAIGGHSYGAFMTANLLAHSSLFRAGIARSGAYNRTLTPFGFQSEDRPFWEVRDLYIKMSPFTYADQIKRPILLIHGMADNNAGTFPIQSERLYAAIKGNGGKVRLVMLPAEAHGYRARESVGHTMWEMVSWLDTYVKSPGTAATAAASTTSDRR